MLTQKRAKEVIGLQSKWPHWGNYQKFLTERELEFVDYYFLNAESGAVSRAAIIGRVANGLPPFPLKEGVSPYEETITF